jgi:hypothetical protein
MKKRAFFFLLFGLWGTLHAQSLPGWTLRKNRDGIRVYSRHTEASKFAEIRVQCELLGTLPQLVAALQDIPNLKDWAFNVRTSRLVEQPSETDLTYHSTIHAPWPVDERDAVIRMQFSQDSSGALLVRGVNQPTRVPLQQGIVRVKESTSFWRVTPVPGTRLRLDYTLRLHPGGTLPAWLVNATLATGPFQTFNRLREAMQSPKYRGKEFGFLKE